MACTTENQFEVPLSSLEMSELHNHRLIVARPAPSAFSIIIQMMAQRAVQFHIFADLLQIAVRGRFPRAFSSGLPLDSLVASGTAEAS
jgi:hypothetical protein